MRTAVLGLALLLAARPAMAAPDDKADAKGLSPGEEVQKLIADFQKAQDDAHAKMRQAKTEEEQIKISREELPNSVPVVARLLELAEKNPKDKDVNPKALLWVVGHSMAQPKPKEKALGILARDYAGNEEIGNLCLGLAQRARLAEPSDAAEKLMRAAMDSDGPAALKGKAVLALGEYLKDTAGVVRQLKVDPDVAKRIAMFGDQGLADRLAKADPEPMEAEAEKQLETAANKYADLALGQTTVGELARGELFELRYLSIGKVAPDIEGEDLDGKAFKLSDYRGKVVVLDFWGNWCSPCRTMYPHERSLVKRTEGKPFALLGINSDADKEKLKPVLEKEEITWRSWWNGPDGTRGPISKKWNVHGWPTTYVLDAKGVIRYKVNVVVSLRGEKIDEAVDALLKEVDAK